MHLGGGLTLLILGTAWAVYQACDPILAGTQYTGWRFLWASSLVAAGYLVLNRRSQLFPQAQTLPVDFDTLDSLSRLLLSGALLSFVLGALTGIIVVGAWVWAAAKHTVLLYNFWPIPATFLVLAFSAGNMFVELDPYGEQYYPC